MVDIEIAINKGRIITNKLLNAEPVYFKDLKPSDIPENISGVYAIFDSSSNEVLYVGRTKNLRQRLYNNHLHGSKTNARLKKYLVEDKLQKDIMDMNDAKQYLKDYCFAKYIVEKDTLRRGKIEGLLSYLLDVRYIHEEH